MWQSVEIIAGVTVICATGVTAIRDGLDCSPLWLSALIIDATTVASIRDYDGYGTRRQHSAT